MVTETSDVLEKVILELGCFRRFHVIHYLFLSLPLLISGVISGIYVFETLDVDYRCAVPECNNKSDGFNYSSISLNNKSNKYVRQIASNDTLSQKCDYFNNSTELQCKTYVYSNDVKSAVKDFDLACQDLKKALIGNMHNLGLFLALPLNGYLSDKYGRRLALSLSGLMIFLTCIVRSFSINYLMMITLEFLESALGGGMFSAAYVLGIEFVGTKNRVFVNSMMNILYSVGCMILPLLAWLLMDWRLLLQVISIPSLFIFFYLWFISESFRWLITKSEHEKAIVILKDAADTNKRNISNDLLLSLNNVNDVAKLNKPEEYKLKILFKSLKSRIIRNRTIICSYLWITCSMIYFGLQINSVSLAGNLYLNYMLSALIEIPSGIVLNCILDKFGRKITMISTFAFSGAACIGFGLLNTDKILWSLLLYLVGKFMISIAYNTILIYASEIFPTNVRQSLMSVCATTGMVGYAAAPLTPLLAILHKKLPMYFFGCLAIVASVLVMKLPETTHLSLPDTMEDAENIKTVKA